MTRTARLISILVFSLTAADVRAYTKQTVMIPMRDGIGLATDIYRPSLNTGLIPCLLMRTPYNKDSGMDEGVMTLLTDFTGYAVAIQDMRGKHASGGADTVYFSDGWGIRRDGYDTVEWLAARSWSDGKIGMIGASASGITALLAAGAAPPHLACCVAAVAASNLYEDAIFYGGEYQKALVSGWLEENGEGGLIPFFSDHHDYGPVYAPVNLAARFDSVNVPVLHVGGWHDIFLQGTINAFSGIQEHGRDRARGNQRLIIGPWVHNIASDRCGELTFPDAQIMRFLETAVGWVDHWMRNKPMPAGMPAAQFYLMGDADRPDGPGNRWIKTASWPPRTQTVSLFLRDGGTLSWDRPLPDEPPDIYDYYPSDPVPTLGGRNLNIKAGSVDQRPVESRDDVLVFTTDELTDTVTVAGRIRVKLFAASDRFDTDFTAKVCDVYPDGRSMLVADGIIQARHRVSLESETLLTPGEPAEFTIDLWSAAIVFTPGHRIRVAVSSSNYPRFEVNPNTGAPPAAGGAAEVARQTVYHDAARASALELPVWNEVSDGDGGPAAAEAALGQNYPNPFNAWTVIPIRISGNPNGRADMRLDIVDVFGRVVRHFAPDPAAGTAAILWKGDDDESRPLPSGVYVARLRIGAEVQVRKMAILR